MPDFKDFKSLNNYIQKQINEISEKKLADGVKDYIVEAVDEIVYGEYEPKQYERRGFPPTSTGLGGKSQMSSTKPTSDGEFIVTDDALKNPDFPDNKYGYDNNKTLAENIEYGYGKKNLWFNRPRPFIDHAKKRLKEDKYLEYLLAEGLDEKGFKIEDFEVI